MRRLILSLALFATLIPAQGLVVRRRVVANGGSSTISFVQRCGTTAANGGLGHSCTFTGAVSVGDLIAVGVQSQQTTAWIITATTCAIGTVTTTPHSPVTNSGNTEWLFYGLVTTGATAGNCQITATTTGTPNYASMSAYDLSSPNATTPLLTDLSGMGTSATITSGSLTISGHAIIIAQMEGSAGNLSAFGASYTGFSQDHATALNGYAHDEYHVVTTSDAATATQTSSSTFAIVAAAFQ